MPLARVDGAALHYESHGDGEPLLLIAGFACDLSFWSLVTPALTQSYRVIAFDNRGMGRSAPLDGPRSLRQMAEDAAGLLDALGIKRAHVAGHSMGGQIALELALSHPERVGRLLLISTTAKPDERDKAWVETFGELPRKVEPRLMARLLMPWLYTETFYATPGAVAALEKRLVETPDPPTPEGIYQQSRAISAFNAAARLGQVKAPTLVLSGRDDLVFPAQHAERLARDLPDADRLVLPNVGHGLVTEAPDAVAIAVLAFLAKGFPPS